MSDLPTGWTLTTFGEIAELSLGKMLDKKQATGLHPTSYLRNLNVRWGSFDLDEVATMDIPPEQLDRVLARPGDVIACEGGEPGRAAVWKGPGTVALQKALHRIRPADGIVAEYLSYLLEHQARSGTLTPLFTGSTIKHLPKEKLKTVAVPLAPAAEQQRIVEAIEEALNSFDAATDGLRRSQRRIPALVAGLADEEFKIDASLRAIGEIARVGSGATPKRGNPRFWADGSVPWVTSGALNDELVTEPSDYITSTALEETSVKLWPAGTVLVAMYGEGKTRGRAAELTFESTCNQACAAIDADELVIRPRYLRWFLNSQYEKNRRLASGGVQPNLSLGIVKSMRVPVPSLELQDAVVSDVEKKVEAAHRLDDELNQALLRAASLRGAVLSAAFAGQLVPQDPSDEPASELLVRIRAERPAKRRRSKKRSKKKVSS